MLEETSKIGYYYRNVEPYKKILSAQENIQKSFETSRSLDKLRLLLSAAWDNPLELEGSHYLGAIRKLIVQVCFRSKSLS